MPRELRHPALALALVGTLLAGALIGAALLGGDTPSRAAGTASPACSESSLAGGYGLRFDGRSEELGRFASVSRWAFDGAGNFSGRESFNSEKTGPRKRQVEGTYEIKGNCNFEVFFPSELVKEHEAFGACVLVDGGNQFFCLDVEKGWTATGTGVKI